MPAAFLAVLPGAGRAAAVALPSRSLRSHQPPSREPCLARPRRRPLPSRCQAGPAAQPSESLKARIAGSFDQLFVTMEGKQYISVEKLLDLCAAHGEGRKEELAEALQQAVAYATELRQQGSAPTLAGKPSKEVAAQLVRHVEEKHQTPPAQQAQQASSYWEHFSQQLAPQLEQLPIRPYAPASPAAAGGRASSFRMAQRGDVLLHCMGTARQTGLPKLQRVLVLGVQSVNEGSPKQSHQVEIVTLAAGANASSLMHQAGQWGRIVLGKAGWMEKDEGVRSVHHWRIQGCVPPAAMVELERALQREAAAAGELA